MHSIDEILALMKEAKANIEDSIRMLRETLAVIKQNQQGAQHVQAQKDHHERNR